MNLVELSLWAMLGATPPEPEMKRLAPVAEAIATESAEGAIWPGEPGKAATAIALVAIARHESGLLEAVRRCKRRGDDGRSIGLYQLHRGWTWGGHEAAEICESDRLQAHLSLSVLAHYRSRCPRCSARSLFQAYASGSPGVKSRAASDIAAIWERIARKAGLSASEGGGEIRWASWRAPLEQGSR